MKSVELSNDKLRIIIIPELGGKIASVYNLEKDFELLFQNKENNYKIPELYSNFAQFDASGFDDAFPGIESESVMINEEKLLYPDHGEVWTTPFMYRIENDKLIMSCRSSILPYQYSKILYLEENSLVIHYEITNFGEYPFPCLWTMHCLINCCPDMELIFPTGTDKIELAQDSKFLGKKGEIHPFPLTESLDGNDYYLNRVLPPQSKNTEKYYVNGKVSEGKCGAYYPQKDVCFMIKYDANKLPYLGFWVTEGGFRGDYNCALEPSNGYYDSIDTAKKNNALPILEPNQKMQFSLELELK